MAVNVSEEDTALISTCEVSDILTPSAPGIQDQGCSHATIINRPRRKWPFRTFGSRKVLLYISGLVFHRKYFSIVNQNTNSLSYYGKETASPRLVLFNSTTEMVTFTISCTIANLLAEVVVGRYKFISFILKAMWFIHVIGLVWYLWTIFCSYSASDILVQIFYNCSYLQTMEVRVLISLLLILLFSVGLILDFCFHHKLVKEPVTVNPVNLVFKVLKYAAKHKYPVQRSAFTYCENEQPTRGKSKYGGPFTTEQVEDVKTFWRVLMVILVISMLHTPINSVIKSYNFFQRQFRTKSLSNCIQQILSGVFSHDSFITYSIPLYELLIYPCLRNRGPSILQSAGIGAAALITSSVYGVAVEAVRQVMTNSTTECMFTEDSTNSSTVVYNFLIANILNFILGLSVLLTNRSRIELICAQAPYNMNSLLIGLSYSLQALFESLGSTIFSTWSNKWFEVQETSTCGV